MNAGSLLFFFSSNVKLFGVNVEAGVSDLWIIGHYSGVDAE